MGTTEQHHHWWWTLESHSMRLVMQGLFVLSDPANAIPYELSLYDEIAVAKAISVLNMVILIQNLIPDKEVDLVCKMET